MDVALLRGTSADPDGNISMQKEAFFADALNQARAPRLQIKYIQVI